MPDKLNYNAENGAIGGNRAVSQFDIDCLNLIRGNVRCFIQRNGRVLDRKGLRVLDVAPQVHEGARVGFPLANIETLDIDSGSSADYIADLCNDNSDTIPDEMFDIVVCTEVLEHVLNPFAAVGEIWRLLKPRGVLLASSPFNFRIHGPLPDCWRFTEHGWRTLLSQFAKVEVVALEDPSRLLMPIHYTVVAAKSAAVEI